MMPDGDEKCQLTTPIVVLVSFTYGATNGSGEYCPTNWGSSPARRRGRSNGPSSNMTPLSSFEGLNSVRRMSEAPECRTR